MASFPSLIPEETGVTVGVLVVLTTTGVRVATNVGVGAMVVLLVVPFVFVLVVGATETVGLVTNTGDIVGVSLVELSLFMVGVIVVPFMRFCTDGTEDGTYDDEFRVGTIMVVGATGVVVTTTVTGGSLVVEELDSLDV